MIDIHSHILFDTDDGAKTLDQSIEIIKRAVENNYTDIVLTPHYFKGKDYCKTNEENIEKLNILKEELNKREININLYLANEVYIDLDILDNLEKNIISTINGSKYLLIEFPLWNKVGYMNQIIFELVSKGITPIIAHPERYRYFHNDIEGLEKLIDEGALLQGNIGSIYGKYGYKCKKMLKKLIKRDMISFLGSDIHTPESYEYELNTTKKVKKFIKDESKFKLLTEDNIRKVINNEKI